MDLPRHFQGHHSPEPWQEDGDLIEYLMRWLDTTCLLPGHELRPAERIRRPETWRRAQMGLLRAGRNHASLAARAHVVRAIEQTEPALAEKLPEPEEHLSTPDVKIADH